MYNMVCRALFLQRALCAVHCTIICDHPAIFSQYWKVFYIRDNEICHILLKQFHLTTLNISTVKRPCLALEMKK